MASISTNRRACVHKGRTNLDDRSRLGAAGFAVQGHPFYRVSPWLRTVEPAPRTARLITKRCGKAAALWSLLVIRPSSDGIGAHIHGLGPEGLGASPYEQWPYEQWAYLETDFLKARSIFSLVASAAA